MDDTLAPTSDPGEVEARLALPLAEAMLTQRAVRRVQPDPVDDRIVLRCLELALEGPTASNGQSWEFVVVKDRAVKASLAAQYRRPSPLRGRSGVPAGIAIGRLAWRPSARVDVHNDAVKRDQSATTWAMNSGP
jgi:nitroreductase